MKKQSRFLEVAGLFIKLGTIGFGGPPATIGMMEEEAVHKREWVSSEYFMEMLAATNIVPGPNATEMAAHLGYIRAGLPGLLAGGIGFILPGAALSLLLGFIYTRFGSLPEVEGIFHGINPVVAAILTSAFIRLGRSAFTDIRTILIAVASLTAAVLGIGEIPIIFIGGLLSVLLYSPPGSSIFPMLIGLSGFFQQKISLPEFFDQQLVRLGLFFLKVGALLFGSTYILIAFIQTDIVNRLEWLTNQQMLDAIAAGQITPGPISATATFVGYVIAGLPGALVATLGMFIPSFLIVILTSKFLPRLNKIPAIQHFLRGVTASAVALIANVTFTVYQSAVVDVPTAVLAFTAFLLLMFYKLDAFWAIIGGILFGLVRSYLL